MNRTMTLMLTVIAAASLAGCVSTKKFNTTVGEMTSRVDTVSNDVEKHGARLDNLEKKDQELAQGVQNASDAAGKAQQTGDAAMMKAADAERLAKGKILWQVTLTNNDLRFDSDRAELTDNGKTVLNDLITKLKALDHMVFIEIQGHTDSAGNEVYNRVLGEKRADIVRDYLHDQGLPLNLMSTISYGESKPLSSNDTREGRAQNRRVEILVLE